MQRAKFARLPDAARRAARHLGTRACDAARAFDGLRIVMVRQFQKARQDAPGQRVATRVFELERLGVAEFGFRVEERDTETIA